MRNEIVMLQADHCITIDAEYVVDGATAAQDRSRFTCAHINHSRLQHNIARRTLRKQRQVQLFASRDIKCAS